MQAAAVKRASEGRRLALCERAAPLRAAVPRPLWVCRLRPCRVGEQEDPGADGRGGEVLLRVHHAEGALARSAAQHSTAQLLHLPCSASSTVAAPLLPVSRVAACIWVLPCQRCSLLKPAPHPHTRAPRPEPPPATLPSTRTQVAAHISAQGMLEALQDVLDEDSPSFTTKLYQVLIYESEKLALAGGGV